MDREEFESRLPEWMPDLLKDARLLTRTDDAKAWDLFQGTVLKAIKWFSEPREIDNLKAWLFTSQLNLFRSGINPREFVSQLPLDAFPAKSADPEEPLDTPNPLAILVLVFEKAARGQRESLITLMAKGTYLAALDGSLKPDDQTTRRRLSQFRAWVRKQPAGTFAADNHPYAAMQPPLERAFAAWGEASGGNNHFQAWGVLVPQLARELDVPEASAELALQVHGSLLNPAASYKERVQASTVASHRDCMRPLAQKRPNRELFRTIAKAALYVRAGEIAHLDPHPDFVANFAKAWRLLDNFPCSDLLTKIVIRAARRLVLQHCFGFVIRRCSDEATTRLLLDP